LANPIECDRIALLPLIEYVEVSVLPLTDEAAEPRPASQSTSVELGVIGKCPDIAEITSVGLARLLAYKLSDVGTPHRSLQQGLE
jgi:hypothetical protein